MHKNMGNLLCRHVTIVVLLWPGANRKKTDQRKIKGNSPHPESTETERLALSQNPSKPVMEGLQEGLSPVPAADDYQNTVSVQGKCNCGRNGGHLRRYECVEEICCDFLSLTDDRGRMALPKLPAHALAEPLIQVAVVNVLCHDCWLMCWIYLVMLNYSSGRQPRWGNISSCFRHACGGKCTL